MADAKPEPFFDLLRRLVRVPKREIDEQEREYQRSDKADNPAKPREIVPRQSDRQVG